MNRIRHAIITTLSNAMETVDDQSAKRVLCAAQYDLFESAEDLCEYLCERRTETLDKTVE